MISGLPRDSDGYVDIDMVADTDVDLDLSSMGTVPPLPDDLWTAIVHSAVQADPDAIGIDIDALVSPTDSPASLEATDRWSDDEHGGDDHSNEPAQHDTDFQSGWATDPTEDLPEAGDPAREVPYDDL